MTFQILSHSADIPWALQTYAPAHRDGTYETAILYGSPVAKLELISKASVTETLRFGNPKK